MTGVLAADEAARTAAFLADTQAATGEIPWYAGGHTDPWDHVEAAMALDAAGLHERAAAAYEWLRATQNPDGSWYRGYRGGAVSDSVREANFTAYLAVGLWHHHLCRGGEPLLRRMWPTLSRAIDFVLGLQTPAGTIAWARDDRGRAADEALLTGNSSIFHSLRCALAVAGVLGSAQPDWELAATRLGHALVAHPDGFAPRDRYAMDWYYPVLGGALRGPAADERLATGWDTFVVDGLGLRCVSDRPWVTGAETAELALALCALGQRHRAATVLASLGHLQRADGAYWTGYVYPDDAVWPQECTTWTAGAVLLADAAVRGDRATTAVFGGAGLPIRTGSLAACVPDVCTTPIIRR